MCIPNKKNGMSTMNTEAATAKAAREKPPRISPSSLYQRKFSPWMLVAIGQTLFFLFGIPHLCRKHVWEQLFGRFIENHPTHGPNIAELAFTTNIAPLFFVMYNLVMIPIYASNIPFFEQYKIQQAGWSWFDPNPKVRENFWKLSRKSLRLCAFNALVLVPILVLVKMYVENEIFRKDKTFFFQTSDEHWPSTGKNLKDVLTMTLIHEFGFYVTHRMMHSYPSLYKFHKVHHEYKINTTLAAQHNHPVDYVISISGPALLAVVLVDGHSISQFQYILWILWANLDDHVGYAFPWSPCRWFPGSALTDEHEFHHSQNRGCFSSKLSIFNSLLGGYEHYEKYYGTAKKE